MYKAIAKAHALAKLNKNNVAVAGEFAFLTGPTVPTLADVQAEWDCVADAYGMPRNRPYGIKGGQK